MSQEEFRKEIEGNRYAVAKFSACWCGPCRLVKPIFEQLASENRNIRFVEVDIDESADVASEYGIMNIPAMLFFRDGEAVDMLVGMQSRDSIKEKLDELTGC